MKYYELYPEVAGSIHEDVLVDVSTRPITISAMHYEIDGWLGDDLLTASGYFIATVALCNALAGAQLTGFEVCDCEVYTSDQFEEVYPDRTLPVFKWLAIRELYPSADLWFSKETMMLNVSGAALNVLQKFKIDNCDIKETGQFKF
jgi:hypothetical protein